MSQEEILMKLVQGLDGHLWAKDRVGWSIDVPACNWEGIACRDGNTVTSIVLPQKNIIATIPSEWGQLRSLETINLKQNIVQGSIPPAVGALPNLVEIDLSNNRMIGTIPKFQSASISKIILADNVFTGSLPASLGVGHPQLSEIDVIRNQLDGVLPETVGMISTLTKLSLSENKFYGIVPANLGTLRSLQYLYLDANKFVGTIPRELTPADSSLKEVWLQQNMFSGTVPAAFAEMKNLVDLYVDGNKFTGQLPLDLCKASTNADFFEGEQADGEDNQRDFCESIACPVGTSSLEGVWPCSPCPAGYHSPYLGREGSCVPRDDSNILHELWTATNGNEWTGNNNWYFDGVDMCDFTGVTCNSEKQVLAITLPNFNLRGTIPENLGFLEHLQRLDLSNNQLYGYLPSDLRFAPLDYIDVSGNRLVGVVPPMLCLSGGVNGNGRNGDYNCDHIVCPSGYYSVNGRSVGGSVCRPCYDGVDYMGRKTCGSTSVKNAKSDAGANVLLGITLGLIVLVFSTLGFVYYRKRRSRSAAARTLDDSPELLDHIDREVGTGVSAAKEKKKTRKKNSQKYREVVTNDDDEEEDGRVFKITEEQEQSEDGSASADSMMLDVPNIS